MKIKILCTIFLFSCGVSYGQTPVDLTITFPENINKERLAVWIGNGKVPERYLAMEKTTPIKLKNNALYISDTSFGKYASVYIYYRSKGDSSFKKGFFINGLNNQVDIKYDTVVHRFTFNLTKRIVDMDSVGRIDLMKFIKPEDDSFEALLDSNHAFFPHTMEDVRKAQAAYLNIKKKQLLFVSEHPDLYLSFVVFRDNIFDGTEIPGSISTDSLWNFYTKYFAKQYQNTYEDAHIRDLYYSYKLSVGKKIPELIQKDVNNKMTNIRKIKSKYVLLNFWASWCTPCVAEMPFLNSIRDKYPSDFLEFVYLSRDKSIAIEEKAALKYKNAYGTHFMYDDEVGMKFNIHGIPVTYLFNSETGEILFISDGSNGIERIENVLKKLYAEKK